MDKVVKTIPENLNLSEAEKSVLQKGLNFIPIKPTTDEFTSKEDCEKFYRRLRLKAFFHDKDHDSSEQSIENQDQQNGEIVSEPKEELVFEQLNPKKSTWVPPPGKFSSLDHYIQRCRTEIAQLDFRKRIRNQNLTREELNALKSLRNRTDIVIKPADKGGAVVVWDRDMYLEEAYKQLSDDRFLPSN